MSELDVARSTFERTLSFLRAGDFQMAERLARAALKDYPGETNFLTLLGASLIRQQRPDEAITILQDVVDSNPDYAKGHEQLGEALLASNRPADAVEPLQRALDLDPEIESAQMQLGRALLLLGREDEAGQVFEAFVAQSPHRERLAAAAMLHRDGKYQEAEEIYRDILRQDPRNVSALRLLGLVAMKVEHHRDAVVLLEQTVKLAPDFRAAWLDLGHAQTELYELDAAEKSMRRAIDLDPTQPSGHIGLANALARSSRTVEAVAAYEEAVRLRPNQPGAYLGLGNTLKTIGRQRDAIAAYRKGIELAPSYAELYWSLSNLKTFRFEEHEVEAMQQALASGPENDGATVHYCFALGKHFDDIGDFDRAFQYYTRGNSLRRTEEYYDPVHTEMINERIREVFTRDFIEANSGGGFADLRPIFIVGLPRSGSTLLEQILASHHAVEATHELPEGGRLINYIDRQRSGDDKYPEAVNKFAAAQFVELGRRYDTETRRYRRGAPWFVDKMPNNFANVGLLSLILPNARFINARRHPLDTCLSCYKQLFARGQSFTYDLDELGDYYLEYQRMMDHWHAVLPGRILDVHYERVVADLEGEVRRLLEYCSLPWDEACLAYHDTDRPIRTASSEQVRRPLYDDAVSYWKNYRKHLNSLIQILQPIVDDG